MTAFTRETYLQKAFERWGDKYDYSRVVYTNMRTKIIIGCKEHGFLEQSPEQHLKGGCGKCGKSSKMTAEKFMKDVIEKWGGQYDYSITNFTSTSTKVKYGCKFHGEVEQLPLVHIAKGCPKCGHENRKNHINGEDFFKRAFEKWGNRYDYSKTQYRKTTLKVIITCPKHGDFEQLPLEHLKKECQKCFGESRRKTTEQFIAKSQSIWGDRYRYEKTTYNNLYSKVIITCPKHGDFEQTPAKHYENNGCKKCTNEERRMKKDDFISKAREIHNHKYNYDKVNFQLSTDKTTISCPKHGDFELEPTVHLSGVGCKTCGFNAIAMGRMRKEEDIMPLIMEKCSKYKFEKNNWKGIMNPISVICEKHGTFEMSPYKLLKGIGCRGCSTGYSKISITWLNYMQIRDNTYIKHAENGGEFKIPGSNFWADGYSEQTNTIYEFHGDFWHGNPEVYNSDYMNHSSRKTFGELYNRTKEREMYIKDLGFNYKYIWEKDWRNALSAVRKIQKRFRSFK